MTQTILILAQFTQTEICSSQNKQTFRGLLYVVETNQTKQNKKKQKSNVYSKHLRMFTFKNFDPERFKVI